MGKHSRYVIGICDNGMRYSELHKKDSNVDGDIIMHILPKDGTGRAARIKICKTVIQEILHTFVTASLLG